MRLAATALATTALIALAPAARAQGQDKTSTPLPDLNPFADAREGDWATYTGHCETEMMIAVGDTDVASPSQASKDVLMTFATEKVAEDQVTVGLHYGKRDPAKDLVYARKAKPSIEDLLLAWQAASIEKGWDSAVVSDLADPYEEHTVAGHAFACRKITCKARIKAGTLDVTMWLSPLINTGIVELEVTSQKPKLRVTMKIAGFGGKDTLAWGRATKDILSPEEVEEQERKNANECTLHCPGQKCPPLKGTTTANAPVALDTQKGRVLVVFYSTWNDCEDELRWLDDVARVYGPHGLTILGVASVKKGDYAAWDAYLAKHKVGWTNIPDPSGALALPWDIQRPHPGNRWDMCTTYVIDRGWIMGGDLAYAKSVRTLARDTLTALKRLYPDIKPPEDDAGK